MATCMVKAVREKKIVAVIMAAITTAFDPESAFTVPTAQVNPPLYSCTFLAPVSLATLHTHKDADTTQTGTRHRPAPAPRHGYDTDTGTWTQTDTAPPHIFQTTATNPGADACTCNYRRVLLPLYTRHAREYAHTCMHTHTHVTPILAENEIRVEGPPEWRCMVRSWKRRTTKRMHAMHV